MILDIERRGNGDVRCRACYPPELSQDDIGWIARSSLSRHLRTATHVESMARYEEESRSAALVDIRGRMAAALNDVPPPPEPRLRSPSPWLVNDISHLDSNGVSSHQFSNIDFSAGFNDEARIQARSRAILERYGVEEIPMEGEPDTNEEDESLGPLPQRIIDGCACISTLVLKCLNDVWLSEPGGFRQAS